MRTRIKQITEKLVTKELCIKGWVRSIRTQKDFSFIVINDGSTLANFQVVADKETENYEQAIGLLSVGASVSITGILVHSHGKKQDVELKVNEIIQLGSCDAEKYPLQKKRHSFEFLRSITHLRPRTNTQGAVTRVRNALAYATHKFFQDQQFLYIHTPIITESDCEGAGELFNVTTLGLNPPPKTNKNAIDYTKDFFGKKAFLTVSGQLNAEIYACSLSDVYTFGPTFRAENSNTSRHLAEFWMIEPEIAFADLRDNMELAENYLKYCINYVFEHCKEDIDFFDNFIKKGLCDLLKNISSSTFIQISYTNAITKLEESGKKFDYPVVWGNDLQTEHERYLCEELFNKPVIVFDYPKNIKPFYMYVNADGKTVAAMDILVPGVGELVGGSQREDRLSVLDQRMDECGVSKKDYWWYRELREYGTVPHAGFGVGFERLVQFITGMENIRDVIPFPRYPKHLEF
jgi:asparaginyl-tRNA synthetase